MQQILYIILLLMLMAYLLRQVSKPTRWVGGLFLWIMNRSHSALTDWGLKQVSIEAGFTILDVGCGGGRTVQKLAALAKEGKVWGIDYADGSVATSRRTNAQLIKTDRVEIRQASVSNLPFPGNLFDLVSAVETQYYWPDLVKDMQEILRVLKPGGTLMIIAESYKRRNRPDKLGWLQMKLLKLRTLSPDEQREIFVAAGYADVHILEKPGNGWICVTGRKPASPGQ